MTSWSKCDKCSKYTEGYGSPEGFCHCPRPLHPADQLELIRNRVFDADCDDFITMDDLNESNSVLEDCDVWAMLREVHKIIFPEGK